MLAFEDYAGIIIIEAEVVSSNVKKLTIFWWTRLSLYIDCMLVALLTDPFLLQQQSNKDLKQFW